MPKKNRFALVDGSRIKANGHCGGIFLALRVTHGQTDDVIAKRAAQLDPRDGLTLIENRRASAERCPDVGESATCRVGRLRAVQIELAVDSLNH